MGTYSGPVTLIIGTHIAVISTQRACSVKTRVGCLLTGVALGARAGIAARETLVTYLIATLGTGTVESIIWTGITCVNRAASATARVGAVTEYGVIAGIRVIGMSTYSGPVTLIIGTDIAVISTQRACSVKTRVGCFLAGVALGARTGITCVYRAVSTTAGIRSITVGPIITDTCIVGILTYKAYTCIVCTHITIIAIPINNASCILHYQPNNCLTVNICV
jgi:uncharacterized membrane protein